MRAKRSESLGSRLGVWFFAVVAMVVAPMFPVFVDAIKTGRVAPETYLLTAAVLAVGYGFSSRYPFYRGAYALISMASMAYDFNPYAAISAQDGPAFLAGRTNWILRHAALSCMLAVAGIQASERVIWHVLEGRQFPDRREGG